MSASFDSDNSDGEIFSDEFLKYNQISEDLEPDIGYLLHRTPDQLNDTFDLPPYFDSPPTPDIFPLVKSLAFGSPRKNTISSKNVPVSDYTFTKPPNQDFVLKSNKPIVSNTQFDISHFRPRSFPKMEKLANCRKYGGYAHENASQFLSEFESYAILHHILPGEDARKIAAFHLHLCGPAVTWFHALPSESKKDWKYFEQVFKAKYINIDIRSPTILIESEIFETLRLSKGQSIDDFYAQLLEKRKF